MIIVLFHAFYLFGKYVYENYYNREEKTEVTMVKDHLLNVSESDYQDYCNYDEHFPRDEIKIKFFPPVYTQRYNAVHSVLTSSEYSGKIHKVIDFGCAELSFSLRLKNTEGIQEIYCIDIDRTLLENYQTKVAPLYCDYLSLRTEPLTIHVCEGSIAHSDSKLANTDAVVCIELIEHLYPDDLEAFPYNVFGFIQPQVAIVTTPNADFNILFRSNGFRHADHKFEWTRAQFQDWANNIVLRYPEYEVSFHGIGAGPGGTEHLGSCSQMAVFHRLIQPNNERPEGVDGLLKTIVSHKYPYKVDNRSDEEKILADAEYYIRLFSSRDEDLSEEIPLENLMFSVKKFHIPVEILRTILQEANWAVVDRENGPVVLVPPQSTFSTNSGVDYDDFLDNDYRYHDGNDDWDALEPNAAHSDYIFTDNTERDPQSQEEEENWDDDVHDAHHSGNPSLNRENLLPDSELLISENLDRTSDNQWTMEVLNNEGTLLDTLQHHSAETAPGVNTETELPSDSFLIGLDSMDINYLNIPTDTMDSFENNLSSPLPLSGLSQVSHSLGAENNQISLIRNSISNENQFDGGASLSQQSDTGVHVIGNKRLKLERHVADHGDPVSCSLRFMENTHGMDSDIHLTPDTDAQAQGTENGGENCGTQADAHSPSNNCTNLLLKDSPILRPKSTAPDELNCHSTHTDTSSISTVEATFLLSDEQSLITNDKDLLLNGEKLPKNKGTSNNERGSCETASRKCSTELLSIDQSISEKDNCCNNSLYQRNEVPHLNIGESSAVVSEGDESLDLSLDSIDPSYQKCDTDSSNIQKIEYDVMKSQDSMSFKSISDCSLDIQPKYTSSPQVVTAMCKIQAQSENKAQEFFDRKSSHNCNTTSLLLSVLETVQSIDVKDTNCTNTYQSDIQREKRESSEVQSSNSNTNLLNTNDVSTRDQNTLRKESLLEGDKVDEKSAIPNLSELNTLRNISLSTSQLSLQSNSDISLSAATSTESSNVDKWYAAESNPMYQRDLVVLKGGNDAADDPNYENTSDSDLTVYGSDIGKDKDNGILSLTIGGTTSRIIERKMSIEIIDETSKKLGDDVKMQKVSSGEIEDRKQIESFLLTAQKADDNAHHASLDRSEFSSHFIQSGFSKQIGKANLPTVSEIQPTMSNCKLTPSNEGSTSCNVSRMEKAQFKYEHMVIKGFENAESKPYSPESLDTPPDSWSPEIMDSGYPNSASVHDITPEYELSSIANDRISDSDSASVGEIPAQGFYEFVEVENGDLANNNRDDEGNNVIAFEADDLDDLQPLIDVLENDMENENDIYVLQNGFPLWLLRILEMANPIDLEVIGVGQAQQYHPVPLEQAGGDAPNVNADNDEGFDSSSSDDDTDIEDDEADDATTGSSDETQDNNPENLRRDWRAGGDP